MATYSSYKELEGNTLRLTDKIEFKVKDKLYFYKVFSDHLSCINRAKNASIFTALDISDKNAFAAHIYGYNVCRGTEPTAWPEYCFSDLEAATNIVLTLFKLCEDYNEKDTKEKPVLSKCKSLYEIGDRVIIKDRLDEGCNSEDYPFNFTPHMLSTYGGYTAVITSVNYTPQDHIKKMFIEPFYYTIKYGGRDISSIRWTASMFKGKVADSDSESKKGFSCGGFSFTRKDIPKACRYHPYVIDQALVEFSKGIHEDVKDPEEAFKKCIYKSVGNWFSWERTSQGWDYWNNIFKNPSFIPSCYTPTYFIEGLPTSTKELIEYYKRNASEAIVQYSVRTSHNSMEIPCSYEEATLSIKKKKVHF